MSVNSFAALKRNRSQFLSTLQAEAKKVQNPQASYEDKRIWKCEQDKAGNGYAVIRFLPIPKGDDFPWVQVYSYGFKGPGGWYIENSLKTLKQKDPVGEANSALWNSGVESDKEVARSRRLRTQWISNILVVSDPKHPENEGQVFLFKYGKQIFDKINDKLTPQFEGETSMNPFDPWDGSNFKLKIVKDKNYPSYEKSEFDAPSPLFNGDEDKIAAIWEKEYSLREFVDPKNFKTYEELKARFEKVIAGSLPATPTAPTPAMPASVAEPRRAPVTPKPAPVTPTPAPVAVAAAASESGVAEKAPWDDEDSDSFFDRMANN